MYVLPCPLLFVLSFGYVHFSDIFQMHFSVEEQIVPACLEWSYLTNMMVKMFEGSFVPLSVFPLN